VGGWYPQMVLVGVLDSTYWGLVSTEGTSFQILQFYDTNKQRMSIKEKHKSFVTYSYSRLPPGAENIVLSASHLPAADLRPRRPRHVLQRSSFDPLVLSATIRTYTRRSNTFNFITLQTNMTSPRPNIHLDLITDGLRFSFPPDLCLVKEGGGTVRSILHSAVKGLLNHHTIKYNTHLSIGSAPPHVHTVSRSNLSTLSAQDST